MNLGLGLGISRSAMSQVTIYDPSVLSLTGWWEASFSASPWTGKASAGSSGSHNLTEGTNPPSAGASVNGYTPAAFDGVNDQLTGTNWGTFYSTTAYSLAVLLYVDTFTIADPGASSPYNCASVLGATLGGGASAGGVAGSGASGVFRYGHHDVSAWTSDSVAISQTTWTFVKAKYDGTKIYVAKNSNAFGAGVTLGTATSGVDNFRIGPNFAASANLNARILAAVTASSALGDSDFDNIKSRWNALYGLSL